MTVVDLPEPKRRSYERSDEEMRRKQVLLAFMWLVVFYVVLHKFLIPLGLKLTALRSTPYARLDWWFLLPLGLALGLGNPLRLGRRSSFIAGAGVLYGASETWAIVKGQYPGWLGVSHALSAIPFAGICISLLASRLPGKRPAAAWFGVATMAAVLMLSRLGRF